MNATAHLRDGMDAGKMASHEDSDWYGEPKIASYVHLKGGHRYEEQRGVYR